MKTGFTATEIFRKYLWYLLRERKFDEDAVADLSTLRSVLAMRDEEVSPLLCHPDSRHNVSPPDTVRPVAASSSPPVRVTPASAQDTCPDSEGAVPEVAWIFCKPRRAVSAARGMALFASHTSAAACRWQRP